jgi:hypothetical protein
MDSQPTPEEVEVDEEREYLERVLLQIAPVPTRLRESFEYIHDTDAQYEGKTVILCDGSG